MNSPATVDNANEPSDGSATGADPSSRLPLLERFVDRMNPILVKEVRQAFKGRSFVLAFALLIFSCWVVSVIGALRAGSSLEYYSWAPQFFASYFIPLAFAIGVVIPFMAYNSMLSERVDDTFDMLSITTLRARKIINGKLANAFVQVMLLYAAFTPFVAFTSLLQGFRFLPAALALGTALFASLALCTVSLYLSTMARTRFVQVLISLALIVGLLFACSSVQLLFVPGFWNIPAQWDVGLAFGSFVLAFIGVILLMREYAIAAITFDTDNRSTGIRVVTSIIVLVGWLILTLVFYFGSKTFGPVDPREILSAVGALTTVTCLLAGFTAFCVCSEPSVMSRRVRKQIGRFPLPIAFVFNAWLPGCGRGFLYTLLHVVPFAWITYLCWVNVWHTSTASSVSYWMESQAFVGIAAALYVVFFSGVVTLVSLSIRHLFPNARTLVVRAWSLIIIAVLVIVPPILILILEEYFRSRVLWEPWMITCPFLAISHMLDNGSATTSESWGIIYLLTVMSVAVTLFALYSVYGSFAELVNGKKASQKTPVEVEPEVS